MNRIIVDENLLQSILKHSVWWEERLGKDGAMPIPITQLRAICEELKRRMERDKK